MLYLLLGFSEIELENKYFKYSISLSTYYIYIIFKIFAAIYITSIGLSHIHHKHIRIFLWVYSICGKISSYMYISELLKMEKEYGEKDTEGEFAYSLGLIFYCYFFTLLPDCCSLCPLPSLLHDNFCIRCVFYYTASGGMLHFSCRCTTVLVLRRNISPSNVKIFISITLIESK